MKSTGAQSSGELQRLDLKIGHQDSSTSNGHQGNRPYSLRMACCMSAAVWETSQPFHDSLETMSQLALAFDTTVTADDILHISKLSDMLLFHRTWPAKLHRKT